ncbi:MAG: tRNA (N(6)-L-threonylcarbamoyladenosine(37)-C(2))-methylthiotransferase MtaB [Dehalococcoidales bacterium]
MSKKENNIKVAFDTLGCKLNQAETEALTDKFVKSGYIVVSSQDDFDIYVLNTCTVTHVADRKARHLLRMAHRRNPQAVLVAVGCYAEHSTKDLLKIDGVKLVLGNAEKMKLPQILTGLNALSFTKGSGFSADFLSNRRTRSFIAVQEGCNNFCSYCIVPYVRGREKSVPPEQIVREIKEKVASGFKEIVLTGTEIGAYNYGGLNLEGLIDIILKETPVLRLRISSLQPQEITPDLINLWENTRLCPHFHLSLQSGSDTVLKRMKRRYTTSDYLDAVNLIRSKIDGVAITTDIIVGFPCETDAEFTESYDFCQEVGFSRIHIFSYSKRRGTAASIMPNQVSPQIMKGRSDLMLKLAEETSCSFYKGFIEKEIEVLWEQAADGIWTGYSGNYIKAYTTSNKDLTNVMSRFVVQRIYEGGVWGEITEQ